MLQFTKRFIKLTFAILVYYSGAIWIFLFLRRLLGARKKPLILLYHRVLDNGEKEIAITQPGMCVTRESFEGQMKYLSRHYHLLPLGQLVGLLKEDQPLPPQSVVITFDDGWKDNYDYALPILQNYRIPATIFLSTDMIELDKVSVFIEISMMLGDSTIWPRKAVEIFRRVVEEHSLQESIPELNGARMLEIEKNALLYMTTLMLLDTCYMDQIAAEMKKMLCAKNEQIWNSRRALNWDEIREMRRHGIDFGSHGKSHDLLISLCKDCVMRELLESKKIIENELGEPVYYFAYPNHDYNAEIRKMVEEAGYLGAGDGYDESADHSIYDIYALDRYNTNEGATVGPMGNFSKAMFACKMAARLL